MQQGGKRLNISSEILPKVSIVCVTLNAAGKLPGLLLSIANFKTADTELVIIDGNSTDGTVDILNQNNGLIDFWLSEPDTGIYEAMNKAINHLKGQWILFLGADDSLADEFAKILPLLCNPATIYYGNVFYYGKPFSKTYTDYYLTKLNICHQCIFYPKEVFNKYVFDLKYPVYADYYLNLRCWYDTDFKFVHLPFFAAYFAEGGFSSYTVDGQFETDRDWLFKQYLKPVSYYRYLKRTKGIYEALRKILLNN
jgi:glycosyltransferase involved in cell wall biosynthesis